MQTQNKTITQPCLTRQSLNGVWSALILPWTDDDELDDVRFAKECRSYGGTGVQGIYTGGTTGEFYAQDDRTFELVTRVACEEGHAVGLPVQIGCTALSTRTARARIRVAVEAGADAIQIAYPFWLELKPEEALTFFKEIAQDAEATPLVIYHTSRCKRKLSPEEIGTIAREVPSFIGMKDTGCDIATLEKMLTLAPDLAIFGGEDFYERIPHGGRGGYCSITGLNAPYIVEYYTLCAAGNLEQAQKHQQTINRLLDEALLPMNRNEGLWDSAIDRVMRVLGGGDVGLRCQSPYRSADSVHVQQVRGWCQLHAPWLLSNGVS